MYTGVIEGVGPRYCPSIEDKIMRFADKDSHQVFIEPESLSTTELYPNGVSTSLPFEAQWLYIRSMRGLEKAVITRPGYAIEYDYFNPQGLKHSLETKALANLYFAGQINGTTGYEEAAAQGLLGRASASAARGQRRPAADRHRPRTGLCQRGALRRLGPQGRGPGAGAGPATDGADSGGALRPRPQCARRRAVETAGN